MVCEIYLTSSGSKITTAFNYRFISINSQYCSSLNYCFQPPNYYHNLYKNPKAKVANQSTPLPSSIVRAPLQSSSSQKHMCPLPPPSVMHTWSTMNRLMSRASVHVRLVLSRGVPLFCTSLTQHPSHFTIGGMSSILEV